MSKPDKYPQRETAMAYLLPYVLGVSVAVLPEAAKK